MRLIDIPKKNVKVGDIAVVENTFKNDVFYCEITKISKETIEITNNTYTKITLKNGYKFALETGKKVDSRMYQIIKYKRFDDELLDLKKDIKRLTKVQDQNKKKVAHDLTLLIEKYLQDNNIDCITFNFSNKSNECNINLLNNDVEKNINDLKTKYKKKSHLYYWDEDE